MSHLPHGFTSRWLRYDTELKVVTFCIATVKPVAVVNKPQGVVLRDQCLELSLELVEIPPSNLVRKAKSLIGNLPSARRGNSLKAEPWS